MPVNSRSDWGARAAYIAAVLAPDRVTHCVGLSVGECLDHMIVFGEAHRTLTLVVLATGPLGLIGAATALMVFQAPFGFVVILGAIALAGIHAGQRDPS